MDSKVIEVLEAREFKISDDLFVQQQTNVSAEEMNPKYDQQWFEEASIAIT